MQTKLVEATDKTKFNWGKFLVGRFDHEWKVPSAISGRPCLLGQRGWSKNHILVLDLETGEGVVVRPGGCAHADLQKHQVWVCPMFEPFLAWLYTQDLSDINKLPAMVDLGDVPTAMAGYRRPGEARRTLMKRLDKTQLVDKGRLVDELRQKAEAVEAAVAQYNEAKSQAWEAVSAAIEDYNAVVQTANEFREGITADQDQFLSDRSEKWQESDAGQAYESWKQEWETELEEVDLDEPDDLDTPDMNAADTLEQFPDEVDQ